MLLLKIPGDIIPPCLLTLKYVLKSVVVGQYNTIGYHEYLMINWLCLRTPSVGSSVCLSGWSSGTRVGRYTIMATGYRTADKIFRNIIVKSNTSVVHCSKHQVYSYLVSKLLLRISRFCSPVVWWVFYDLSFASVAVFRTMPSQYRINIDRQSISD